MKIKEDISLVPAAGFSLFEIEAKQKVRITFDFENSCNILIRILNAADLQIEGKIRKDQEVTLFFWNENDADTAGNDSYHVEENALFKTAYFESNPADSERKIEVFLDGKASKAEVYTAGLISSRKNYSIRLENRNISTSGKINNRAVILNGGKLMIDAIGKIIKGARRSQSHQTSKALSFQEGQEACILPELLIDENDVQASHALSIGRVDENQLYYLMSRGLDLKECLKLISLAYLLPVTEIIADQDFRNDLSTRLERKIAELCSM